MHVKIVFFVEIIRHTQAGRPAPDHRKCRLNGFLHNVTQRAGFNDTTLTWRQSTLYGQQFAADLGPCQTGHLSDLVGFLCQSVFELFDA